MPVSRAGGGLRRALVATLKARALRRGVLGGSGVWTAVAVVIWLPRVARRLFGRRDEHLATERLRPGDTLSVVTSDPRARRARRGAG